MAVLMGFQESSFFSIVQIPMMLKQSLTYIRNLLALIITLEEFAQIM